MQAGAAAPVRVWGSGFCLLPSAPASSARLAFEFCDEVVRIGWKDVAGCIEQGNLLRSQRPTCRSEIIYQLFHPPCANDGRRHPGLLQEPFKRHLSTTVSGFLGDFVQT